MNELVNKIPALQRTILILQYVGSRKKASLHEIVGALHIPQSSAYLLLGAMVEQGLLRQGDDGRYSLGLYLYELGNMAVAHLDTRREALPFLHKLMEITHLTCHLGVLEGQEAIYLLKVESPQAVIVRTWEGKRVSLHSSALGKVLLAWKSDAEIDAVLNRLEMDKRTATTITDKTLYKNHLLKVRQDGWAIDDEEDIAGIRCIAAPVRDARGEVIASVSAVGPSTQIGPHDFQKLAVPLLDICTQLSASLGFRAL